VYEVKTGSLNLCTFSHIFFFYMCTFDVDCLVGQSYLSDYGDGWMGRAPAN